MYYDLDKFGKKVIQIRKSCRLNRTQLADLSLVSIETIRKIEKGKHIPSQYILDDLSKVLKVDLNKLILYYRLEDFKTFDDIRNRMESKFDRNEYNTLEEEYDDFNSLLLTTKNQHFIIIINQLMLLIKSVILNKKENNPNESLKVLINALRLSIVEFSLSNYQSFIYNSTEIRILMAIALLLRKLKTNDESINMLEFCMGIVEPDDETYPKLCNNLANIFILTKKHNKALELYNLGIDWCMNNRKYGGLSFLYYGKGITEYDLGYEGYIESLNKAIYLCEVLGQDQFKKVLINKCRKFCPG